MSIQLSDKDILSYLTEDIPDIGAESEDYIDDDDQEISFQSPLNEFDIDLSIAARHSDSDEESNEEIVKKNKSNENPSTSTDVPTQIPTSSTSCSIEETSPVTGPNRKWKKKNAPTIIPDCTSPLGAEQSKFSKCKTATDVFVTIIGDTIEPIVYQSNLYATQKHKNLNLKPNEFLAYLGINFLMGYHQLPSKKCYWNTSEDLNVRVVSETMSRDRFDSITYLLHVNDNNSMLPNITDKLYKLRPFIDTLNCNFRACNRGTSILSVDESMITFKGRSSIKQYNPMKPIKRGYKVWCLADQNGYILNFDIYQGKNETVKKEFTGYGLGERVVLNLTKYIWGHNRIVCFDNYFSSVPLLETLKNHNTLGLGTIRPNRKGLPANMVVDKQLKRGEYDFRIFLYGIGYFKWNDNRIVHFISNYHGTEESSVTRTQSDGSKRVINCPPVVSDYNKYMGGVVLADRLRALYHVNRKSKKWWHRIFFGLMDIAFVNAYVVYNQLFEKTTVLEFRRSVALGLMAKGSKNKVKRSTGASGTKCTPPKRRKSNYSVVQDVRLGNKGVHWPQFTKKRGRCEQCSKSKIESRPFSICSHCKVHLCINDKKNCFSEFHEITF